MNTEESYSKSSSSFIHSSTVVNNADPIAPLTNTKSPELTSDDEKKDNIEVQEKRLEEYDDEPESISSVPLTNFDEGVVGWDSVDDPENPQNWSTSKKWRTMGLVSFSTFLLPLASTIFAPGVSLIAEEFNVRSTTVESLMVSIFIFGFGWGPLLLHAPVCELYGRKISVLMSNIFFALFMLGCAFSKDVGTFFTCRFLGGLLGCASVVVGGGVISDMFTREAMGRASAVYTTGPLIGPVVGPIIGGFMAQNAGWRWIFRFLVIAGFGSCLCFYLFVQETNHHNLLRQKAKRLRKQLDRPDLVSVLDKRNRRTPVMVFVFGFTRPLALLFTNPIAFALGLYMGISFAYLYIFLTTISTVFQDIYHFRTGVTGLAYLGLGMGLQTALFTIGWTNDQLVRWLTRRNNGVREPEFRLYPLYIACVALPGAMFWYGWAVQTRAHWFAVVASMFPLGIGMVSSSFPIETYLIEIFAPYGLSASATAAGNCFRMTTGAFFPLVAPSLFSRLDYGWGCSLLGFLALGVCGSMSVGLIHFGKQLRLKCPPTV
ncbi:major facilitator superfamily domain-containing protein [Limtongia smithiae]|uniref:major facilitator superfamily domain-containing protein n=1 Tax=Limtongia smithiae TaxID=1125753 RepID=UPI0034CD05EE